MKNIDVHIPMILEDKLHGRLYVGVPCNHVAVQIGDVFRVKYELVRVKDPRGGYYPRDAQRLNAESVLLSVEKIFYFRESVDILFPGHTGGLVLSGKGLEALKPDCMINTDGILGDVEVVQPPPYPEEEDV
jgi:hypothetical protein